MIAVEALRECLTQCQVNEGLDPIFCQERCSGYTPGDVGPCTGLVSCFVQGFEAPQVELPTFQETAGLVKWIVIGLGILLVAQVVR